MKMMPRDFMFITDRFDRMEEEHELKKLELLGFENLTSNYLSKTE